MDAQKIKDKINQIRTEKGMGYKLKYCLENYKNLQYQLMIIAGGTLTVFISLNQNNIVESFYKFYKYGFIFIGLSLIFGAFSIFLFEQNFFFKTGIEDILIDKQIFEEVINNNLIEEELKKANILYIKDLINQKPKNIVFHFLLNIYYNDYLLLGYLWSALIQFILFIIGLILIILGLYKT